MDLRSLVDKLRDPRCYANVAGEDVVIEPFRDRVLVRYRNTYVREIDVRTGSTRSLVIAY